MTVHLIARRILPCPGGLQESVMRIGGSLAGAGLRVVVYALDQPSDCRYSIPEHNGLCVVYVDGDTALVEPYGSEPDSGIMDMEKSRARALNLRNAVARHMDESRQVMISFYASGTGFTAQMIAAALRIPHIASVRGTDFELDIFGAKQHVRLRMAVEAADVVVTTNREQADSLTALFRPRGPVRTIHNALAGTYRPLWQPPPSPPVRLISDCGFSGRKATQLLLRAAAGLMDRGIPVIVTILGGIFFLESPGYWQDLLQRYQSQYPNRFSFPGHVDHAELENQLRWSHIYCSATLAEGSSLSRISALTLGIPIVTTDTGGLRELAAGCHHVRLCPAGDGAALAAQLEAATSEILAGTLHPDPEPIQRWRRHFSIEREREEWLQAIEAAAERLD